VEMHCNTMYIHYNVAANGDEDFVHPFESCDTNYERDKHRRE